MLKALFDHSYIEVNTVEDNIDKGMNYRRGVL
jgi:hypothetical protein